MSAELIDVSKKYGNSFALKNVDLSFETGKIYGLLGPNGSGKSSTLKLLAGLVYPSSGTVAIDGEAVTRKAAVKVGYLTELDMFYDTFSVENMIDFYESQFHDFDKEKALQLLEYMELQPRVKIKQLSKGKRGRLKLVLVLSRKTDLLLLDEPFSGLDPMVRDSIVRSLLSFIDFETQTVIIATHEINEIEALLDEAYILQDGIVKGHCIVEELREERGISVMEWLKSNTNNEYKGEEN
ncbi:ABC transporter ATP-binding protein [Rossellomorea vietnamensis]|uniref:ABC transporter ATP-binding protein n=1 Tax=Rossellomorea vietnamensis TaxID=218284 RepID=A0A5D4KHU4_9BACI|nr:ABC transporter ATP-binding protein [Rossellomorea vietnamensis]TYR76782.1 ABC transporter ATP-binding protein [Rossellomorea vietnamensis]